MGLSRGQFFTLLGAGAAGAVLASPLKALGTQPAPAVAQAVGAAAEPAAGAGGLNVVQAFVLGIVQGLTEFLPISSSAHLKVVPVVLGWGDPGVAFTAVIQLGSIAAVLWYFWADLTQVVTGALGALQRRDYEDKDFRLGLGIALGTVPILAGGLLIKLLVEDFDKSPLRSLAAIACASIVMSLLLGVAERIGTRKRDYSQLDLKDGVLMGLAQAMALIPGVSRSGSTLTAGLFMGLERAAAARFSFLLGIPAITLAGLVELKGVLSKGFAGVGAVELVVGVISAAVFSYASIAWLLRFLQTQSTWVFIWYRLAFGVAILSAIAGGALQNS
ncbi:MAG: undecaprenyl-diphosphate phosphatase [Oscillatoria princeps RMCB-10]|jgi:undecaprenyl-diphosphatase|nr:undecaprenyl-diphosphate phosphatase [Oscillatoria princeps RMCB-10]